MEIYKNKRKGHYVIQLAVIDKEFAEMFSRVMAKLLGASYHKPYWDNKQKEWRVVYRSKAFYKWYKKSEEQGLQGFKEYIEHDIETVKYYLRGVYDSDGNNYRNKLIQLSNSNKKLLEYVQYLLKKYFNIKATGPYLDKESGTIIVINGVKKPVRHDCYTIVIGRKLHVQKFLKEIGFSIARKQLGLRKDEKIFIEGKYVESHEYIKRGLFRLLFINNQYTGSPSLPIPFIPRFLSQSYTEF